ncbi:MAG TPA: GreA/GreB family elongation factor [Trueperaceae bacterium]|nr:GreA/GreB family elongation factor [Trueperaceae bacterium]
MAMRVRVTQEGYERLQALLEQERERLEEATRILQELTGSSDDYDDSGLEDAKTEKARIEQRIDDLEDQLGRAVIIEDQASDVVDLGSVVKLAEAGKKTEEFSVQLVSPVEAGVLDGDIPKVSDESPLGKALKGRGVGDEFEVVTGERATRYVVKEIA